jgi:hypothetical protein
MMLEKLDRFWLKDMCPLDGRVVFVLTALLFLAGHEQMVQVERQVVTALRDAPEFYNPESYMRLLLGDGPPSEVVREKLIVWLQHYAMPSLYGVAAAAAIGLFGRLSWLLLAIQFTFQAGLRCAAVSRQHAMIFPLLLCWVMAALYSPDARYSADALIARFVRWYPFAPPKRRSALSNGALAKKVILVLAVYMLFAGGVAKVYHDVAMAGGNGLGWAYGGTLQYYLSNFGVPQWFAVDLHAAMVDPGERGQLLCMLASSFSFALEFLCIFMLFWRSTRIPMILAAWSFHIGIYALLYPRFFGHMVCYLFALDWPLLFQRKRSNKEGEEEEEEEEEKEEKWSSYVGIGIGMAIVLLLVMWMYFQLEWYPLSYIPMYGSVYRRGSMAASIPFEQWNDAQGVQNISRRYVEEFKPWDLYFEMWRRIGFLLTLRHRGTGKISVHEADYFVHGSGASILGTYTWWQKLTDRVTHDLAQGPPIDTSATAMVRRARSSLQCEALMHMLIRRIKVASIPFSRQVEDPAHIVRLVMVYRPEEISWRPAHLFSPPDRFTEPMERYYVIAAITCESDFDNRPRH